MIHFPILVTIRRKITYDTGEERERISSHCLSPLAQHLVPVHWHPSLKILNSR